MHDIDRTQFGYGREMEMESYPPPSGGPVINENEAMELAAELMELTSEAEFENFLGDLISKLGSTVGGFFNSPTGQALGGLLKGAARKILPMANQAIGGYLGAGQDGEAGEFDGEGSSMFEMESDEREWEAANTFVKLAGDAIKTAAQAPPGADPSAVANQAVTEAAQMHAPSLLVPSGGSPFGSPPTGASHASMGAHRGRHSGRWIRRGNHVIVFGV